VSRPRTLAALAALWLCWGSSFPAIRVMVTLLPPLLASGTVFLLAGCLLGLTRPSRLRGLSFGAAARTAGPGICLLGAQGAVAVAETHVFASTAAVITAAIPLWVAVLRIATGDRPTAGGAVRLLAGFAGVSAVLLASSGAAGGWTPWTLTVLGASVAWAAGTLLTSRARNSPAPRAATVIQLAAGGIALLTVGCLTGELNGFALASVHVSAWGALAYLVLVDSLAGFALYNWLLRTAPVSVVSTYSYAVPVVAYLIGVAVLHETFRPIVLIGAALIVAAVAAEIRASPAPGGH